MAKRVKKAKAKKTAKAKKAVKKRAMFGVSIQKVLEKMKAIVDGNTDFSAGKLQFAFQFAIAFQFAAVLQGGAQHTFEDFAIRSLHGAFLGEQ